MEVEETEDIPDWITQAEKSLQSDKSLVTRQPTIQTANDVVCIQAEIAQLEIQCKQIWTKIIQLKSTLKSHSNKSSVRNNELVRSLQKR